MLYSTSFKGFFTWIALCLVIQYAKMGPRTLRLFTTACFLFTISPVLSLTTVSIFSLYPNNQHFCVPICVSNDYSADIGRALNCGDPYANDCFCNTGAASAAAATSWLAACASTECSAGDLSDDLTSMHSLYASYCIGAGFTQPGATDWYNPASATANPVKSSSASPGQTATANPGQTATSGPDQTTTQLTVVTQTAPSTGRSAATQPLGKFLLLLAMVPFILLQVPLPAL